MDVPGTVLADANVMWFTELYKKNKGNRKCREKFNFKRSCSLQLVNR